LIFSRDFFNFKSVFGAKNKKNEYKNKKMGKKMKNFLKNNKKVVKSGWKWSNFVLQY
jgi:5-methylcytosine-specific restriction endonuclease McrA